MTHRGTVFALSATAGLLIIGVLSALIVMHTGDLRYSLDDPYIHLRVSELIAAGGYGVNVGESAAPSSSILFPFLLAPFAGIAIHAYVPLLLCVVATLVSLWFLAGLVSMSADAAAGSPAERSTLSSPVFHALFIVALGGALNLFGIAFTGLEHSLHIALSIGIVAGCVQLLERDHRPRLLVLLIILCPLIRFEGLALSGIAILLLAARRRWLAASLAFAGVALALIGWGRFAAAHGLPLLPSSVTSKSRLMAQGLDGGGVSQFIANTLANVDMTTMSAAGRSLLLLLFTTVLLLGMQAWRLREQRRQVITCLWLAALAMVTVAAHAAAGRYGWFGRYENYARLVCIAVMMWALFGAPERPSSRARPRPAGRIPLSWRWLSTAAVAGITVVGGRRALEMQATLLTPQAALEIYSQQHQMARFAHDFAQVPVAVNDLGLVSYGSPHYVLDLWGLGSEAARIARSHAGNGVRVDWISPLVDAHGIRLAMIYDKWFPVLPSGWCRLGDLTLGHASVIPVESEVAFYATSIEAAPPLLMALHRFVDTLPPGAMFTFASDDRDGCPMPPPPTRAAAIDASALPTAARPPAGRPVGVGASLPP